MMTTTMMPPSCCKCCILIGSGRSQHENSRNTEQCAQQMCQQYEQNVQAICMPTRDVCSLFWELRKCVGFVTGSLLSTQMFVELDTVIVYRYSKCSLMLEAMTRIKMSCAQQWLWFYVSCWRSLCAIAVPLRPTRSCSSWVGRKGERMNHIVLSIQWGRIPKLRRIISNQVHVRRSFYVSTIQI